MKIISLNGNIKLTLKRTCVAIGIFDGVHRGHQYLIRQMLTAARRLKARSMVITFYPHPAHVLSPEVKLGYLTSLKDRLRCLSDLGVAVCLVVPFNRSFAKIRPQKFIKDILVKKLGAKAAFVGREFRFGKDRRGDISLFQSLSYQYGYEMHAVAAFKQGGEIVSSTRIRRLISEGKFNDAARLLGRPWSVSGDVVKGAQRGKTLGYPTANVEYEAFGPHLFPFRQGRGAFFILPPQGVYVVRVLLGAQKYPAIANIGTRPSFEKQASKPLLEVHILDFSGNIYGKHLKVEFLKKIRNEKKFSSPQNLIRQIQKDEAFARKCFALEK